jgi:GH24 family phage-related lysozyme (muramidase)
MRFAQVVGLTALVYINLVESEFLLSYSSEPIYKKDLTEREVHTANGLVNKSVFKRVKKEGKIAFIRNTKINESNIKVRLSLTEQEETSLTILMNFLRQREDFRDETYDDFGKSAIGYGRQVTGHAVTTKEKEEEWLRKRAQAELDHINKEFPGLNKYQQASVGSLLYNLGHDGFRCKSGTNCTQTTNAWNALKAGDLATFEREAFDKDKGFVYANSQIVKGLQNRRQKELELFKQQQKQQELATPEPKLDVPKHNPDAPEQPIAQVPKYGTVEWYKKYGTDPNPAVDA